MISTPAMKMARDVSRRAFRSANHSSSRMKAVSVMRFVAFDSTRTAPTGR